MKQSAISQTRSLGFFVLPLVSFSRSLTRAHVAARKPPIWETPETQPPPPACAGKEADCNYWAHRRVLAQLEVDVTALCIVERRVPWVVRGHG
jgi:hypothetical protein